MAASCRRGITGERLRHCYKVKTAFLAWWRHQMETFSASLALCAGSSPVTGEFPTQRPVTRSCDVFFDLRVNKWLSKQSWCWWFETPSSPLWSHYNGHRIDITRRKGVYTCRMIMTPSYLDNGNSFIGKTTCVYWHNCECLVFIVSSLTFQGDERPWRIDVVYVFYERITAHTRWIDVFWTPLFG